MYIMVCILFHALVAQFLYMQVPGFQVDYIIVNHDAIHCYQLLWYCGIVWLYVFHIQ